MSAQAGSRRRRGSTSRARASLWRSRSWQRSTRRSFISSMRGQRSWNISTRRLQQATRWRRIWTTSCAWRSTSLATRSVPSPWFAAHGQQRVRPWLRSTAGPAATMRLRLSSCLWHANRKRRSTWLRSTVRWTRTFACSVITVLLRSTQSWRGTLRARASSRRLVICTPSVARTPRRSNSTSSAAQERWTRPSTWWARRRAMCSPTSSWTSSWVRRTASRKITTTCSVCTWRCTTTSAQRTLRC
mmetsp:Transcript_10306/g.35870  ORF Transcript_10306/g.35870 Transcript_10306/m.35870 type:complete len:244 (-) Transcript_10306:1249-1980(-)